MTRDQLQAAADVLNLALLSRELGKEPRHLSYVLAGRKRLTAEDSAALTALLAARGIAVANKPADL